MIWLDKPKKKLREVIREDTKAYRLWLEIGKVIRLHVKRTSRDGLDNSVFARPFADDRLGNVSPFRFDLYKLV